MFSLEHPATTTGEVSVAEMASLDLLNFLNVDYSLGPLLSDDLLSSLQEIPVIPAIPTTASDCANPTALCDLDDLDAHAFPHVPSPVAAGSIPTSCIGSDLFALANIQLPPPPPPAPESLDNGVINTIQQFLSRLDQIEQDKQRTSAELQHHLESLLSAADIQTAAAFSALMQSTSPLLPSTTFSPTPQLLPLFDNPSPPATAYTSSPTPTATATTTLPLTLTTSRISKLPKRGRPARSTRPSPSCLPSPQSTTTTPSPSATPASPEQHYACTLCTYTSTVKYNFQRHADTHNPHRAALFRCRACRKEFSAKSSAKRHCGRHCRAGGAGDGWEEVV